MEFSIRFTEEGKKALRELHIETQSKIKKALKELAKDLELGKPLVGNLAGFFSLPMGGYRAVYTIEQTTIFVHYVGHRKDVYQKFK